MTPQDELIKLVVRAADELGIDIMVIGAWARDYWVERFGLQGNIRTTFDIDFACQIAVWNDFDQLRKHLRNCYGLSYDAPNPAQSKSKIHTLWLRNEVSMDIVPCGEIADENGMIAWPPDYENTLCVLGYDTAKEHAEAIAIGDSKVKIIKLHWLALLKLQSYIGNPYERGKDLNDLFFIARNYFDCIDADTRIYAANGVDSDLLAAEDFDYWVAGAELIIRDCQRDNSAITTKITEEIRRFDQAKLCMDFCAVNNIKSDLAKRLLSAFAKA